MRETTLYVDATEYGRHAAIQLAWNVATAAGESPILMDIRPWSADGARVWAIRMKCHDREPVPT